MAAADTLHMGQCISSRQTCRQVASDGSFSMLVKDPGLQLKTSQLLGLMSASATHRQLLHFALLTAKQPPLGRLLGFLQLTITPGSCQTRHDWATEPVLGGDTLTVTSR